MASPMHRYEASNIDLLSAKDNMAVFGLRHQGAGTGQTLRGSIADARIYDRAMCADDLRKLTPKKESAIKPYAWWTFEKGKETDRMGRFPVNNFDGGAKIEDGRLVLQTEGATLIAATHETLQLVQTGTETPAMPAMPPANWLTYHLVHPGPGGACPEIRTAPFTGKAGIICTTSTTTNMGSPLPTSPATTWCIGSGTRRRCTRRSRATACSAARASLPRKVSLPSSITARGPAETSWLSPWTTIWKSGPDPLPIVPRDASGQEPKMRHWDPDCWLNGETYYAHQRRRQPQPDEVFRSQGLEIPWAASAR